MVEGEGTLEELLFTHSTSSNSYDATILTEPGDICAIFRPTKAIENFTTDTNDDKHPVCVYICPFRQHFEGL